MRKWQATMYGYKEKFIFGEIFTVTSTTHKFICNVASGKEMEVIGATRTLRGAKIKIANWYKKYVAKRGERIWKAWKWEEVK